MKNKISLIPPLLRKEFYSTKIAKDINKEINLLIIGGSQGAKLFDTAIKDSIIKLSKKYKLNVILISSLTPNLNRFLNKNTPKYKKGVSMAAIRILKATPATSNPANKSHEISSNKQSSNSTVAVSTS